MFNQEAYSTLWNDYSSDEEAKIARNKRYREIISSGGKAKRWVLKNQTRKYSGFGQPNGRSCNVFMISIYI